MLALGLVVGAIGPAGAEAPRRSTHGIGRCDWPMWGYRLERTFATRCHGELTARTVKRLRLRWFFNTDDVVTATPAVAGGTLYVGDWSGKIYALRTRDGKARWTYRAEVHPEVYSGQIVGSAAVADVAGTRTVYVPAGKTLYALRAKDGSVRWRHELGQRGDRSDPTEIESSPVVVDGMVIIGWDVHNSGSGRPAGVVALDARTGRTRWKRVTAPTTGDGATGAGCGDVWGAAAVDRARALVIVGTGNCPNPSRWGQFSEALVGLDLHTGAVRWTYQPHGPNRNDTDFAGAPNLFDRAGRDGRPLAGLGNKDGVYYVVDRATGAPVAQVRATQPGITRPDGNYSTGGFIGPTAYQSGVVVGGTGVGPPPYLHGIDVQGGALAWQSQEPSATYGATAIASGIAFVGGTDFTLRAVDVRTGRTLWSHAMRGAVSGGAAITGGDVFAVAGIREPGLDQRSRTSGVYRFALHGKAARIRIPPPPTTSPRDTTPAGPRRCVDTPCDLGFDLKSPPPGLTPTASLVVTERPFRIRLEATGLGPPSGWLRAGSPAASAGATAYAVFLSESDDNPTGGLVCVLDAASRCTGTHVPRRGATYNRVTLVAVKDAKTVPTLADGFDRLVTTGSFDPPLRPVE